MRNGFQQEPGETAATRSHPTSTAEQRTAVDSSTAQAISQTQSAANEIELYRTIKKELVWQNLFTPAHYCRWMSVATIVLVLFKVTPYLLTRSPYTNRGIVGNVAEQWAATGPDLILGLLPYVLWAIAFLLFYLGAMPPALSDQAIETMLREINESALPTEEVREAAIRGRNHSRQNAIRATQLLWLGIALSLFTPLLLQLFHGG